MRSPQNDNINVAQNKMINDPLFIPCNSGLGLMPHKKTGAWDYDGNKRPDLLAQFSRDYKDANSRNIDITKHPIVKKMFANIDQLGKIDNLENYNMNTMKNISFNKKGKHKKICYIKL